MAPRQDKRTERLPGGACVSSRLPVSFSGPARLRFGEPGASSSMPAIPLLALLWGQASPSGVPAFVQNAIGWLHLFGEPMRTIYGTTWTTALLGGLLTWVKVVSLFCLLG